VLSQQFAARGLQFFKVNKNITHVAVARPHYLDLDATPVSNGIRLIVTYISAHPRCTRRQLFDALLPASALAPVAAAAPAPPTESPAPVPAGTAPVESQSADAQPAPVVPASPSPEMTALISDLHWLIHQGHVLEFADGMLETAKKPLPRPPKPQPAAQAEPSPGAAPTAADLAAETPPTPPTASDQPPVAGEAPVEPPASEYAPDQSTAEPEPGIEPVPPAKTEGA
jgi:hypothetical protein